MGLREWLVEPYLRKLNFLELEVRSLRDEVHELTKILDSKADRDDIKDVRVRLNSLLHSLDNVISRMDAIEVGLQKDQILGDYDAQKELVLRLIRLGYNSPKDLKERVPFGNKKLYEVLKELERERLVKKLKKKRKVYYVVEEEAY